MEILAVFGVVAIVALLIFWNAFRLWIGRQLNTIWGFIQLYAPTLAAWLTNAFNWLKKAIGIYSLILLCATLLALILMFIALMINWPPLTAFLFVFSICLVIVAWLPAGLVLRLFRLTDGVIPAALKVLIAWTAFVGFLGLMCPDVLTFRSLLGAALVGFIFLGVSTKFNALDGVVAILVIGMCLWTAYGYFWPESQRSNLRIVHSTDTRVQAWKDRKSIENETVSSTTYAVTLRDVVALYKCTHDTVLTDVAVDTVKRGTIVKIVSRKHEVKIIDEQGFVEIQLANKKGLFVGGKDKYFVEAEFVELATPRDITPKEDLKDLLKKQIPESSDGKKVGGIFPVGKYPLALKQGEESDWCTMENCKAYTFEKSATARVTLTYEDGTVANSWDSGKWPNKYKFKVRNLNKEMPVLQVM